MVSIEELSESFGFKMLDLFKVAMANVAWQQVKSTSKNLTLDGFLTSTIYHNLPTSPIPFHFVETSILIIHDD